MHELTPEELLSAYLDGELTADEQARAERLLAADSQARRLFDELRGMRSSLQGLPRHGLPDDFAGRVLRSAERQTLSSDTPAAHDSSPSPGWQERIRRPLAYAAMVLAASVLIAIFNPEAPPLDGPQQPVVLAPQATESPPPPASATPGFDAPSISAAPDPAAAAGDERRSGEAEGRVLGKLAPARKGDLSLGISPLVDGLTTLPQGLPQPDNGLLVVTCEITPSAARQGSFRQVLTRNQIAFEEGEVLQRTENQSAAPLPPASRESTQKRLTQTELDVIYVEAPPQQLEAALADMADQPNEFLSVDVGAAEPRGAQTRWQKQYSRGRGGMSQQRDVDPPRLATSPQPAPAPPSRALKPATSQPQPDDSAPANRDSQSNGRARGYAMPVEGWNYQRAAPPVMLQQQQQQQQLPTATGGTAAANKLEKKADNTAPPAENAGSPAQTFYAQQPGTQRALFVLRVADEPKPAAEKDK